MSRSGPIGSAREASWRRCSAFLAVAFGPVFGSSAESFLDPDSNRVTTESVRRMTLGTQLGAGADVHVARRVSIGFGVHHNSVKDFEAGFGPPNGFNGVRTTLTFGWLFGKGR